MTFGVIVIFNNVLFLTSFVNFSVVVVYTLVG